MNFLSDLALAQLLPSQKSPLVLNPGPTDVIVVGRRAVRHEGNGHFYKLVESRRGRLRDCRCEILATEIINVIAAGKGRFLRGINTLLLDPGGVRWMELDFAGAFDVVLQAFQEDADDSNSTSAPPSKRAKVTPSPSECSSPGQLAAQCGDLGAAFARDNSAQKPDTLLVSIRELQMKRDILRCLTTPGRDGGTSPDIQTHDKILHARDSFILPSPASLKGRHELLANLISRSARSRRELEESRESLTSTCQGEEKLLRQPSPLVPDLHLQQNKSRLCPVSSSTAPSDQARQELENSGTSPKLRSPLFSSTSPPSVGTSMKTKDFSLECLQQAKSFASKTTRGHFSICWANLLCSTRFKEGTNDLYVSMGHVETHILKVLCSHGLPVWSPRGALEVSGIDAIDNDDVDEMGFSWADFANLLIQAAIEWRDRPRPTETSADEADSEAKAVDAASSFSRNTRDLAMTTVALLEKVRACSGRFGKSLVSSSEQWKTRKNIRDSIARWLTGELARWAATLDTFDPYTQMAIPFCSSDYSSYSNTGQFDNISATPAALFDKDAFDVIFSQIACISRLRSVCAKNDIARLLTECNEADTDIGWGGIQVWSNGPSWWVNDQTTACNQDITLLQNLLQEGYLGILSCHISTEQSVPDTKNACAYVKSRTYYELGLSYRSIEERIEQLAFLLHTRAAALQLKTFKEERSHYLQSRSTEKFDCPSNIEKV